MESIAKSIVPGAERMLGLSQALLKDVPDDRFARLAAPGGKAIEANHPAFIYGHLSLYPASVLRAAGLDASAAAVPEGFEELFQAGVPCQDDPDGTVYPSRAVIEEIFLKNHRAAIDAVSGLPDAKLAGEHAEPSRLSDFFPTLGEATSFLLLAHTMLHLGQMSTWRRAIGLGSAM